jgi:endonuclease G
MTMKREFRYLPHERILELFQAFVATGMASHRKLDDLNRDMNRHFAAGLDTEGAPKDRLLRTLSDLNRVERLNDGSVPFAQWLGAAEPMMLEHAQVEIVRRALRDVDQSEVGTAAVETPSAPPPVIAPEQLERIKAGHRTDMLPFAFLTRGAVVGRSVARLRVPRHDGGQPAMYDGEPKLYLGTGWLLTSDLLITNHHVLNARDENESKPAAEPDLCVQAEKTQVQFGYEAPDSSPETVAVAGLEAWSAWTGPLDYAIVRLRDKQDETRSPLRLCERPLMLPDDVEDYPALNIIQHPLGGPKMVAFRNNQVVQVTDVEIWYYTDTRRGASGAPVLDDAWQAVALHKRWTPTTGLTYQGKKAAWVNVGTQIAAILADLKARKPELWGEILGR